MTDHSEFARSPLPDTTVSSPVFEDLQTSGPDEDLESKILRTIIAYNALTEEPQPTVAAAKSMSEKRPKVTSRCDPPRAQSSARNVDLVWMPPPAPGRVRKPGRREQGSSRDRFDDKENNLTPGGSTVKEAEVPRRRTRLSSFSHKAGPQARSPFSKPTTTPAETASEGRVAVVLPSTGIPLHIKQRLAICALPIPVRLRYATSFFTHPYIYRKHKSNAGLPTHTVPHRKNEETALFFMKPKIRYLDSLGEPYRHPHRFEVVVTATEEEGHESYEFIRSHPEEAPTFHVHPSRLRPIQRRTGQRWKVAKSMYAYVLDQAADFSSRMVVRNPPTVFERDITRCTYAGRGDRETFGILFTPKPLQGFEYMQPPSLSLFKRLFLSRKTKAKLRALFPDPRAEAYLREAREALGDVEAPGQ